MHNEPGYAELHAKLKISKDHLDDELIEQPGNYFLAAEQHALAVAEAATAKDNIKKIMGKMYKAYSKAGGTQNIINAKVESCKAVRLARKNHHEKILSEGRWSAMKDAFAQRAFILKDLTQMHLRAFFGEDSVTAKDRNDVSQADYGKNRAAMAQGRKKKKKKDK